MYHSLESPQITIILKSELYTGPQVRNHKLEKPHRQPRKEKALDGEASSMVVSDLQKFYRSAKEAFDEDRDLASGCIRIAKNVNSSASYQ